MFSQTAKQTEGRGWCYASINILGSSHAAAFQREQDVQKTHNYATLCITMTTPDAVLANSLERRCYTDFREGDQAVLDITDTYLHVPQTVTGQMRRLVTKGEAPPCEACGISRSWKNKALILSERHPHPASPNIPLCQDTARQNNERPGPVRH